jgi:flagellin
MTRINHNINAMITTGALQKNNKGLAVSLERLSTGLRINRAADDVAGLSVSEKMRTQVRGTATASRNASDGIALLNIAEGALNEVSAILQRMRELSIQSSNDTVATVERTYLNQEFQSLMEEIQRIALSTQYNGMTLLDGGPSSFGTLGGASSILHVGANFNAGNILGTIDTLPVRIYPVTLGALGLGADLSSLTSREGAFSAIGTIDDAIRSVSMARSGLGAVINRLDHALKNLEIQETNMQSAESTIRDVDFAKEMTEFTRNQILTQSATSMLAQANSTPEQVLSLLQ